MTCRWLFGMDYLVSGYGLSPTLKLDAPLVFVGYGLVAPEHGRDDYAGLDVKGKIVVALSGAPKFLQTEERAYYRSGRVKAGCGAGAWRGGLRLGGHLDRRAALSLRQCGAAISELGHDLGKPDGAPFVPVQAAGPGRHQRGRRTQAFGSGYRQDSGRRRDQGWRGERLCPATGR